MDLTSTVRLNNGVEMPWLGFGVFLSEPGLETERAVRWALEVGYRHVDTAAYYRNEDAVGKALQSSDIDRDKVFLTTKVWNSDQGYDSTLAAFDKSRKALGVDVVDLYLIHWPAKGKYRDAWKAMEKLHGDGKIRAIGVSNFMIHHLADLRQVSDIVPAVNQVEFHPFLMQKDLLTYDQKHGIQHEAWSPLTRGRMLANPVIADVASRLGKTNAQVLLRWCIQHGVVAIPKSVHRERIVENAAIFDFQIPEEDMARLDALDSDTRIGPHPDRINF
jgi:diketogulonate reductase-like aldo/keto reductase